MLGGTIIFSLGSPGMNMEESTLVTRRLSEAIVAFCIRNQISLFMSPDLVMGTFPVVKWCFADLYKSLLSWAAIQAALLKKDESP